MRRIMAVFFIITIFIAGCANNSKGSPTPGETSAVQETVDRSTLSAPTAATEPIDDTSNVIEVDKNLLNVTITLPSSWFQDDPPTQEKLDNDPEKLEGVDYVLNDDGSISMTMSRSRHKDLIEEFALQTEEVYNSLISDETPSFKSITHDADFKDIRIVVDQTSYENSWDSIGLISVYLQTAYYHIFNGEKYEDVDFKIHLIDEKTNVEFKTSTYQEYIANMKSDN